MSEQRFGLCVHFLARFHCAGLGTCLQVKCQVATFSDADGSRVAAADGPASSFAFLFTLVTMCGYPKPNTLYSVLSTEFHVCHEQHVQACFGLTIA